MQAVNPSTDEESEEQVAVEQDDVEEEAPPPMPLTMVGREEAPS